jgi:hypothetical protein
MAEARKKKDKDQQQFLLAYTYFLNIDKSTYVIIGYDCNTFKTSILFGKKSSSVLFSTENWANLYDHIEFINKYTFDSYSSDSNKFHDRSGAVIARITKRKGEKVIEILQDSTSKVALDLFEWTTLIELIPFLRSVLKWYDIFNNKIENYYKQYLIKCREKNVLKLSSNEFFVPNEITYNYCNFSRLFHELPILCKHKLAMDLCFD